MGIACLVTNPGRALGGQPLMRNFQNRVKQVSENTTGYHKEVLFKEINGTKPVREHCAV